MIQRIMTGTHGRLGKKQQLGHVGTSTHPLNSQRGLAMSCTVNAGLRNAFIDVTCDADKGLLPRGKSAKLAPLFL
eukprot:2867419-Amphidinium_carterae.1